MTDSVPLIVLQKNKQNKTNKQGFPIMQRIKLFNNKIVECGACGDRRPAYVLLTLFLSKLTLDGHNKLLGVHFTNTSLTSRGR